MGNISKKTRKKLIKVIEANCHYNSRFGSQDAMFVPYNSSPLSAIWKYICVRYDGVFAGRLLTDRSEKYIPFSERYCCINAPEQLFAPRAHIEINKQIVNRLKERNQLYAVYYTWRKKK